MLKCKQVAHEASDYVDHNLSGWQRFWMTIHLFICHNCRRFVRHLRITRDFGQRRPPPEAGDEDIAKVMEKIKSS